MRRNAPLPTLAVALSALLLSFASAAGCEAEPIHPQYEPCRCDVEGCSAQACSYELQLHPNCAGQVPFAEVLVDDHLEDGQLTPGHPFVPCMRTEPGSESKITVRGGVWIWGPLTKRCDAPGGTTETLIFECAEPTATP